MKSLKIAGLSVAIFFAPTGLLWMMFTLFGLPFQPGQVAAIGLTIFGAALAPIAIPIGQELFGDNK